MKITYLSFILLPFVVYSEPNLLWFQDYNGTGEESHGHYVHSCDDGGFIQVGETYDYSNNSSKVFIVKTDGNGLDWSREIGIGDHNLGNSVLELSDGFLIAGGLNQNSSLIKLDKESGSTIFIQTNDNGGVDAYEQAAKIPEGIHSLHGVKGTLFSLMTMVIFKAVKFSMSIWPKGIECNMLMRVS